MTKTRLEEDAVFLFFDGQDLRVETGGVAMIGRLKNEGDAPEVVRVLNRCINELGYGPLFRKPTGKRR